MEQYQAKPKKKNRKHLKILLVFLSVFIVFIYMLTRPSLQSTALRELKTCYNKDDVKTCWSKYKADLFQDDEFILETRNRLTSFNLSENEIIECKGWLPPPPTNLNLIIVPDLSTRIADTLNDPEQIKNDTTLLNFIWNCFVAKTKLKSNTKDRLILDVTDEYQAAGQFHTIANNLIFDLAQHKGKSNRLFFDQKGNQFNDNVKRLYDLAKQKTLGADYYYYFNNLLSKYIQKPTLFDNYRNVLIILTDGYLEAQNKKRTGIAFYTGSLSERKITCSKMRSSKSVNVATDIKPIPDCTTHFTDLEVLVLEIKERHTTSPQEPFDSGTPCDFEILKSMWTNWFKQIGIKNANDNFFLRQNVSTDFTKKEIENFLNMQ